MIARGETQREESLRSRLPRPRPHLAPPELMDGRPAAAWTQPVRVRALVVLNLVAASFYVGWWIAPGREGTRALFVMLAVAEGFNLVHLLGFWWSAWAARFDPPPPLMRWPSIDVLIPTKGEPLPVLGRTIRAAVNMNGPHRTFVLDDASRPEVAALAERLGVGYIARSSSRGAKAGNLNDALAQTDGELVAIFDADHVPRRDFLTRILGYFEDPSVAIVQTPQYYGNGADDELARGAYFQQAIFYGPIARGKHGLGAAFCCGTNVVFRREALDSVGGFDERSVVEDFVTSMRIHRKGWRSVYYPYVLAEGLGPSRLGGYFRQQFRWSRGSIGALMSGEPFKRGLTATQRVQYLLSTTFYLIGLVTMIYLSLPIVYLLTGHAALAPGNGSFFFFYAPYMVLALTTIRLGMGGRLRLRHLTFTFGTFIVYAMAAIASVLRLPARFNVTEKGDADRGIPALALVPLAAVGATLVAMVAGPILRPIDATTVTNMAWAAVNVVLLSGITGAALREVRARRGRRAQPHPASDVKRGMSGRRLLLPEAAFSDDPEPPVPAPVRKPGLVLAGITAVGFALRAGLIGVQSLRLDEAATLRQAQMSIGELWESMVSWNVHIPLYHTLMHGWIRLTGTEEWVMRVPSVVLGTAAIPLLYLVARRLLGQRPAMVAAVLGAVSPFWIWHSDEARMYPLVLTLTLASTALLLRAVADPRARWWVAYAVVTALSLYSHYFALLIPPVHLAYLVITRPPRGVVFRWLGASAVAGVAFLPWLAWLYLSRVQEAGVEGLTNGVRFAGIDYSIYGLLHGLVIFLVVYIVGYHAAPVVATIGGIIVGLWPLAAFRAAVGRPLVRRRALSFLLAWLVLTVGTVVVATLWRPGLLLQRYLVVASPPVVLLTTMLITRLTRRAVAAATLAAVFLGSIAVGQHFDPANPAREDFRGAVAVVERGYRPSDAVVVIPAFTAPPVEYYFEPDDAVLGVLSHDSPAWATADIEIPALARRHRGGALWVIIHPTYTGTFSPEDFAAVQRSLDSRYRRTETHRVGTIEVRRYAIPG